MTLPSLDHNNVLTLTISISPTASLEELYSEAERFLRERRAELNAKNNNADILAFLQAERSYLEAPE